MGGVFAVTAVELAFAEVHGGNNRHFHHRSDLVDGPVRHPDGTLTPAKEPSVASQEDYRSKEIESKAFMQCMFLEMGILFHSVFIGASTTRIPSQTNPSCVVQAWPSVSPAGKLLSSSSSRSFSTVRTPRWFLAFLGGRHVPRSHNSVDLLPRVRPARRSRRWIEALPQPDPCHLSDMGPTSPIRTTVYFLIHFTRAR